MKCRRVDYDSNRKLNDYVGKVGEKSAECRRVLILDYDSSRKLLEAGVEY